ncbi:acyltransferase [Antrihabitans cavernicola]|uniref:acyltransferase n=1 Tax=Antrihabitans cavernicola TaxID=2495913 RepID=UPI001F3DD7E0|nr:acyltransferase [Spelaeibacter cavernicola]
MAVALASSPLVPSSRRRQVLKAAGVRSTAPSLIHRGVVVQGLGELTLGPGVFINYGCYFDTVADITVGARVFIADHVRVLTSSHELGTAEQRASTLKSEPVEIGAGSWIGSGVVIMPGVTIGAGTVIAANSLVTSDCKPDSLYVGSPAKFRRELP